MSDQAVNSREEIIRLYQEGKSGIEIANAVGLSWGRVYQILREEGISRLHRRLNTRRVVRKIAPRDRVVDKILQFLKEHPRSTVIEVAAGIGHENQTTVRCLLSRMKKQEIVRSDEGTRPADPFLWYLPS